MNNNEELPTEDEAIAGLEEDTATEEQADKTKSTSSTGMVSPDGSDYNLVKEDFAQPYNLKEGETTVDLKYIKTDHPNGFDSPIHIFETIEGKEVYLPSWHKLNEAIETFGPCWYKIKHNGKKEIKNGREIVLIDVFADA